MSALKPEDEMFLAQVAESALALELSTISGVIEGEDDDGNPAFVAIVVGVEVYESLEEATAAVKLDDSEAVPANVTIQ